MSMGYSPGYPGPSSAYTSSEADILWGNYWNNNQVISAIVNSAAVDSTNTPTTALRPGLVLGQLDSDGSWIQYSPSATDGSQQARGILLQEVMMLDPFTAAGAARNWNVCVGGPVKAGNLIGFDAKARAQLHQQGFVFDDDLWNGFLNYRRIVQKSANYTVLASDNGVAFSVTGGSGVTFTLPTIAQGLRFTFLNTVDQNMVITGAASTILGDGNAAATSATFSTASHKIGSEAEVIADYWGGSATLLWRIRNLGGTTMTMS